MSQQQVQRLQTLLETVQRNRQRPGEPMNVAAANVVQKKSPANTMASATAPAAEPPRARVATPEPATGPAAAPPKAPAPAPQAARPAREAAAQPPAPTTQPKSAPRIPEPQAAPQPVAQEPIVPRMIEPEAPRPATRPIAQLVSKHAPVVDATFGAMLKRSLSLRPH